VGPSGTDWATEDLAVAAELIQAVAVEVVVAAAVVEKLLRMKYLVRLMDEEGEVVEVEGVVVGVVVGQVKELLAVTKEAVPI